MKRVRCSIVFYYDPETFLYDWDEEIPSDETIFNRCKEMMLEDVTDFHEPLTMESIQAEFIEID